MDSVEIAKRYYEWLDENSKPKSYCILILTEEQFKKEGRIFTRIIKKPEINRFQIITPEVIEMISDEEFEKIYEKEIEENKLENLPQFNSKFYTMMKNGFFEIDDYFAFMGEYNGLYYFINITNPLDKSNIERKKFLYGS